MIVEENDGCSSSSTVSLNVSVSVSPSLSVTVYVYVVSALVAEGVPDSSREEAVNVSPVGSAGASEYVSGASPPVAAGKVSSVIALVRTYTRSAMLALLANAGDVSCVMVMLNVAVAESSSASVAVYV